LYVCFPKQNLLKNLFLLPLFLVVITCSSLAQTTATFILDANGEDATIDNYNPSGNYPGEIEMSSRAWTINNVSVVWRNLFKFDLSCIPQGAIVQSASLSLYYAAQNGFNNQLQESLTSSNESVVQRATSAWTENTVTWNNQPTSTGTDEVILPQSTSGTQDYTNLNVTAMVQQMISNVNNGFLLKLTTEVEYANLLFASGDNPDFSRHPKLVVTYTVPGIHCVTIHIDQDDEDATVDDYNVAGNYPNEIELASRAWTISNVPTVWRSFFKFEFPCYIWEANIESAHLSLYYAAQNGFNNQLQESLTSSNESRVQRVTSPWSANTVSWSNQPSSTTADEIVLAQSTSGTQNYTNLDVTAMVQQMAATNNYGFLLRLTNETYYANMLFASGNNPDSSRHPKLEICYSFPTAINEIINNQELEIFPNPCNGEFTLRTENIVMNAVEIFNAPGKKVFETAVVRNGDYQVLNADLSPGIYFVKVSSSNKSWIEKLVVE